MKVLWTAKGREDYLYWQETDAKILVRINELIRDTRRSPFAGIGKPEPLRNEMSGWWSRRVNHEHRLVYRVIGTGENQALEIVACRFHYHR
ncbi:Txe/YoeB family addiction module toxin [Aminobacter niigataensis]|uniref:Txe/YoeB family addiction module toxin n=1 Tax=Aminobacter niigataensis TaxID=83265 RepID=UPI0024CCB59D|nr:Txe/YoeB family addiction module toxin [Aminobacter niigataensis]CAI2935833.1 ribosome-dependent mRNA interferase toxin YoeB [Aminobacter niigataensis]